MSVCYCCWFCRCFFVVVFLSLSLSLSLSLYIRISVYSHTRIYVQQVRSPEIQAAGGGVGSRCILDLMVCIMSCAFPSEVIALFNKIFPSSKWD